MAPKNSYRDSKRRDALSELFSDPPALDSPQKGSDLVRDVVAEMNSTSKKELDRKIEEAGTEETKLKKLIPGETQIGTKTGMIQGELRQIKIFYGNFINPMNIHNGKYVPLKKKEYLKILNEFLDSEEGKEYQRPDDDDINRAFTEVKESVNRYIESQSRKQPGMMQPGRSQAAPVSKKEELSEEDKGGQPQDNPEQQRFADDLSEEERKEVELIQAKQYTKQQMKEIRKGFDSERRRSSLTMVLLILLALLVLGIAIFLAKDVIKGSMANIELELKQEVLTLRTGEIFNAPDYVKYVTDDNNVYIIYPTLDTGGIGEYDLDYVATNNYKNVKKTLKVKVVDGTAPVIVLNAEEIKLVRNRDEDSFDPMTYIETLTDDTDEDPDLVITPVNWEKDEQILIYKVQDSHKNTSTASLKVLIEDKAVCDKNATYDEETNTCSCNKGYRGDGSACKLITSSSPGNTNPSGNNSGSNSDPQLSTPTPSNPEPSTPTPPSPTQPFISASSVTVKVGTSLAEVQAKLVAGISSSSGYWVDYSAVNTSVPGSYPVYIHGNDGAEGSCSVTVVE